MLFFVKFFKINFLWLWRHENNDDVIKTSKFLKQHANLPKCCEILVLVWTFVISKTSLIKSSQMMTSSCMMTSHAWWRHIILWIIILYFCEIYQLFYNFVKYINYSIILWNIFYFSHKKLQRINQQNISTMMSSCMMTSHHAWWRHMHDDIIVDIFCWFILCNFLWLK